MARFETAIEVIDSLCLRSGDLLRRNKGLYLDCVSDTFDDMNRDALKIAKRVKIPVRRMFQVNKRTNSITLPPDCNQLNSINVIGHCGEIYPVYRNDSLHEDIVELAGTKDCACEHKCGYKLCNTIKGYEAVVSIKTDSLPNGNPISFTCVDRKAVDSQGFFYSETQYPLRIYTNSIWTDTVLHTEQTKLCQVEVDSNGCVCDTEQNINSVCHSCGIHELHSPNHIPVGGNAQCFPDPNVDHWIYYCDSKMDWFGLQCGAFPRGFNKGCNNIYNISELGNRVVLPHNFGYDHVLARYYADIDIENLRIPLVAKPTFMKGLQYYSVSNNDKKQDLARVYKMEFGKLKFALLMELNKYRVAELKYIVTPPIHVPSYMPHWEDRDWGFYY